MWLEIANTVRDLHRTFSRALDPYHPEQHYMRGPGPACRAKRAVLAAAGSSTRADGDQAFAGVAEAHA
jgi:hypothetical protein